MLALVLAAALAADPSAAVDPIGEGIRLLDAGRYREAAEVLRSAQRVTRSPDAALLEGICRYELGEDAEAARLLKIAETDPAHRATARLYLGLLALREGSARDAAAFFDSASSNAPIAAFANDLARAARWEGPLLLSLWAQGGYDSNVSLTSDGVGPRTTGDATGAVSALAIARPFGPNGLFLRASGAAQGYARLGDYDFNQVEGAAGWRWWRGADGFVAEYAFTDRTLGGSAFLITNRLLASGSLGLGRFALSGGWQGRWESYAPAWDGYSGFAQRADGRASVTLAPGVWVGAGWTWAHDGTHDPILSWSENGPRADLRVALGPRSRATVEAGWVTRTYDAFDAALGVRQRDEILDLAIAWELDVGRNTTVRLSLLGRRSSSNVAGFDYTKVVPTAGIGVMMTP